MMMYSVLIGVGTTPKGVATFFFLFQVGEKAYYTNYAIISSSMSHLVRNSEQTWRYCFYV